MALHDPSIIELRGVSRFPPRTERPLESAVHEIDLRVAAAAVLWLDGPVGGGKELVFRLLSLTEMADAGDALVEARSCHGLTPHEVAELRARRFGFLSATPFLIPTFNAIENIAVPLLKISHLSMSDAQTRIADLLTFVGLMGREEKPAAELTPLDQARLTLARALANAPAAVFVEEFDSALAPNETAELAGLLRRSCEQRGTAVVALRTAGCQPAREERRLEIVDGRIERDSALLDSALS